MILKMDINDSRLYNRLLDDELIEKLYNLVTEEMNPNKEKTRDIVGDKMGLSGKSLEKAQKVIDKMDSTYDEVFVEFSRTL